MPIIQKTEIEKPKIRSLIPYYGSSRLIAPEVGKALAGIPFVAVPFCGGLAELLYFRVSTVLCNDLHRHVINLAIVAADPKLGPTLFRRLRRLPFHPETLESAQRTAKDYERSGKLLGKPDIDAAAAYFVSQWMGRSGKAGTAKELDGGLAIRWNANGGDSALRYSNAVQGLRHINIRS